MITLDKKIAISLILLVAIFACKDAEQLLMPLIPDGESIPTRSLGDPFENGTLQNPNWKWQAEPPTSSHSDASWGIRDNHLFIETEPNRNLWATDATHLLYQEIDTDAFDVETRFTVKWDTSSGVTGIVVKSPADDNWVTLKFWARDAGAKGFYPVPNEAIFNGTP